MGVREWSQPCVAAGRIAMARTLSGPAYPTVTAGRSVALNPS